MGGCLLHGTSTSLPHHLPGCPRSLECLTLPLTTSPFTLKIMTSELTGLSILFIFIHT